MSILFKRKLLPELKKSNQASLYRLHIYVWVLFIIYESVIVGLVYGIWANPLTYFGHYLLAVLLFYLHADLTLPWSLNGAGKAWLKLPGAILLELLIYVAISYALDLFLVKIAVITELKFHFSYRYCLKALYREIYLMGFSTGYYFVRNLIIEKRRTAELEELRLKDIIRQQESEQALMKAQNAFLKAQINPHFLFNTLDFIYHKTLSLSPDIADAIAILADIMRHAIDSDQMGEKINLIDEIGQVENLINLYRIKESNDVGIELIYIPEKIQTIQIIPLVLLTLVENIFKHGDLSNVNFPAVIKIKSEDSMLYIETVNRCNYRNSITSGKRGLQNVRQRLEHAYGKNFDFQDYQDAQDFFYIKISISAMML